LTMIDLATAITAARFFQADFFLNHMTTDGEI
jgi:hypothetical protein